MTSVAPAGVVATGGTNVAPLLEVRGYPDTSCEAGSLVAGERLGEDAVDGVSSGSEKGKPCRSWERAGAEKRRWGGRSCD